MSFTVTTQGPAPTEPLPIKTAARHLDVSPTPLRKALAAGVLPDLSLASVGIAASRGILTSLATPDGAPIPVLRLAPAYEDTTGFAPHRTYGGYSTAMTDQEVLNAADRWWTSSGRDLTLTAGALPFACGGFVVGLLAIHGTLPNPDGIHYDAELVARLDGDAVAGTPRILIPDSPLAELAADILGLRVLGGRGGSITSL